MSKVCIPTKISSLRSGFEGILFFWKDPSLFVLLNASLIVKVTKLNEKIKITESLFTLSSAAKMSPNF